MDDGNNSAIVKVDMGYELSIEPEDIAAGLDKQLFGNDQAFNSVTIVVKDKLPLFESGDGPKLTHVNDLGIVVGCDCDEEKCFHNFFIPWSQIVHIAQAIAT